MHSVKAGDDVSLSVALAAATSTMTRPSLDPTTGKMSTVTTQCLDPVALARSLAHPTANAAPGYDGAGISSDAKTTRRHISVFLVSSATPMLIGCSEPPVRHGAWVDALREATSVGPNGNIVVAVQSPSTHEAVGEPCFARVALLHS